MLLPECGHPLGLDLPGHGAVGCGLHQDDPFAGAENLDALRHEADAAEKHRVRVGGGGLLGQGEAVPQNVGAGLHFRGLVCMRRDNGVVFPLQAGDSFHRFSHEEPPFAGLPAAFGQQLLDFFMGIDDDADRHLVVEGGDEVGDVFGHIHLMEPGAAQ